MVPPDEIRDGSGEQPEKARWPGLFQRSTEAVFVLNRRRRLVYVNRAWEAVTGIAARDARGWLCKRKRRDADADWPELVRAALAPPPEVLAGNSVHARRLLPSTPDHPGPQWWDLQFVPFAGSQDAGQDTASDAAQDVKRASVAAVLGKIVVVRSQGIFASPPLPEKIIALRERLAAQYRVQGLDSDVPAMKRAVEQARLAAGTRLPAMILGEPGTGKHWLARLIHRLGPNRDHPFCRLECARLPASVREALFEPAGPLPASGTVYLQDVAGLPRELQDRLRQRLESSQETGSRLLASLTADPGAEVQTGRLLAELHCALSVLTISLPPLRERLPDLPRLIEDMLERAGVAAEHPVASVSPEALDVLRGHRWPGNLRELYDVLVGACARANSERLELSDLPLYLTSSPTPAEPALPLDSLLEKVERRLIELALRLAKNNKSRAAELLAIWRPRLLRRMEALGLK